MDRADRRYRSQKAARRQYDLRRQLFLGGDLAESATDTPHYWSKRSALGCNCRKRRRGNPRVARGLCTTGGRDGIYEARSRTRRLRVQARRLETDWESDEIENLLFTPK